MIELTEKAVNEIGRIIAEQHPESDGVGLRVGVKGGGCSGLSYTLDFDTERAGDKVIESDGVHIYCDPKSFIYLNGTTLDFDDGRMGRGFKFRNPNAKRSCGCGESFSA